MVLIRNSPSGQQRFIEEFPLPEGSPGNLLRSDPTGESYEFLPVGTNGQVATLVDGAYEPADIEAGGNSINQITITDDFTGGNNHQTFSGGGSHTTTGLGDANWFGRFVIGTSGTYDMDDGDNVAMNPRANGTVRWQPQTASRFATWAMMWRGNFNPSGQAFTSVRQQMIRSVTWLGCSATARSSQDSGSLLVGFNTN
ncbi:MAG: hypothetical protein ACPG77_00450, partial [Nannocystaceae bacterium]